MREVDSNILKYINDLCFPKYILDLAVFYANCKAIVAKTSVKTYINEFCNT